MPGTYESEGLRGEVYDEYSHNESDKSDKVAKESEVSKLLHTLEKEIDMLSETVNIFIQDLKPALSTGRDEKNAEVSETSNTSSPLGRHIEELTHRLRMTHEKINDAKERIRI